MSIISLRSWLYRDSGCLLSWVQAFEVKAVAFKDLEKVAFSRIGGIDEAKIVSMLKHDGSNLN